jgi:hypothetical protein
VLLFNQQELEHRMVFLEQILHLRLLVALLVLEHMILIQQVKHSVSQKVINAADTIVTSQTAASGTIAAPNLYSNATTQLGGDKGTLAGTLSAYWCSYRHCWWFWHDCYCSKNNRVECIQMKLITPVLLLAAGVLSTPAYANTVVPNFTRGTINATTETTTKIVEVIRQIDYTTGSSYTVTGTNITFTGTPAPGNTYTLTTPGAPFQFSETYLGPGIAKETWLDRTTEQQSTTTSVSVFTQ